MRVTKKSGGGPIAVVLLLPAIGAVLGLVLVGLGIREASRGITSIRFTLCCLSRF